MEEREFKWHDNVIVVDPESFYDGAGGIVVGPGISGANTVDVALANDLGATIVRTFYTKFLLPL